METDSGVSLSWLTESAYSDISPEKLSSPKDFVFIGIA